MTETTVRSFERGLRVIHGVGSAAPAMTLAEVARATELNRATARRLLLTLEEFGYVCKRNDHFALASNARGETIAAINARRTSVGPRRSSCARASSRRWSTRPTR